MTPDREKNHGASARDHPSSTDDKRDRQQSSNIISFLLNSCDDGSIKRVIKLVEKSGLSRNKVCIVSILSKEPLEDSVRDELVQTLLHRNLSSNQNNDIGEDLHHDDFNKYQYDERRRPRQSSEDTIYDSQIEGHIQLTNNIVVLNIKSTLDASHLAELNRVEKETCSHTTGYKGIEWPGRCHNLLKTLLLAFLSSHIIVCYNTEPSIDYSIIRILKVLRTLRLKSTSRITDVLEAIASTQAFPRQWVKQARVSCPKLLFVCNTSHKDIGIDTNNLRSAKREIEDQIYSLLKGAGLLSRPIHNQLFELPEQGDFLFLLTRHDLSLSNVRNKKNSNELEDDLCRDILRLLNVNVESSSKRQRNNSAEYAKVPCNKINEISKVKFRKFIYKQVSVIQAHNHQTGRTNKLEKSTTYFLPRCDNLLTAMLKCNSLLFQLSADAGRENTNGCLQPICSETRKRIFWNVPDLRQFVDVYNNNNVDEAFSRHYCHKASLAAMDMFYRVIKLETKEYDKALDVAISSYNKYARGPAYEIELKKLIHQCNKQWLNIQNLPEASKNQQVNDESSPIRVARTRHGVINGICASTRKTKDVTITRQSVGVKIVTNCDCGLTNNILITPVNRSKKLERINVRHLDD